MRYYVDVYNVITKKKKEVSVIDFDLPNRTVINELVLQVLKSVPDELCQQVRNDPYFRERVVEAALGLTAVEASNVFSKSLIVCRDFDIDTIIEEKKNLIRKSGLLEFYQSDLKLRDIGGLEILKAWLKTRNLAFSSKAREFGLPLPKGILLIGIPGCGKSLTAKAVGAPRRRQGVLVARRFVGREHAQSDPDGRGRSALYFVDGRVGKRVFWDEVVGIDRRWYIGSRFRFVYYVVAGKDEPRLRHGNGKRRVDVAAGIVA